MAQCSKRAAGKSIIHAEQTAAAALLPGKVIRQGLTVQARNADDREQAADNTSELRA